MRHCEARSAVAIYRPAPRPQWIASLLATTDLICRPPGKTVARLILRLILRAHFGWPDVQGVAVSFGSYLFLHAQLHLIAYPGWVLLLSPILGEFSDEDSPLSPAPATAHQKAWSAAICEKRPAAQPGLESSAAQSRAASDWPAG